MKTVIIALIVATGMLALPAFADSQSGLSTVWYHPTLDKAEKEALQKTCMGEGQAAAANKRAEFAAAGEPATPTKAYKRGEAIGTALIDGMKVCLKANGYQTIQLNAEEKATYDKLKKPEKQTPWLVELAKQKAAGTPAQ